MKTFGKVGTFCSTSVTQADPHRNANQKALNLDKYITVKIIHTESCVRLTSGPITVFHVTTELKFLLILYPLTFLSSILTTTYRVDPRGLVPVAVMPCGM